MLPAAVADVETPRHNDALRQPATDLQRTQVMLVRDDAAERVIGCAIAVHRAVGPGLLESAYHACLASEFRATGLTFKHQVPVALVYRDTAIACAYRLDFVIEDRVILEVKSVEHLLPVHKAQVITYLKLTGHPLGLLINFCVPVLKDGIRSVIRVPSNHGNHRPQSPRRKPGLL